MKSGGNPAKRKPLEANDPRTVPRFAVLHEFHSAFVQNYGVVYLCRIVLGLQFDRKLCEHSSTIAPFQMLATR